jgi:DNA polymerase III epsilon subunit-like protein
MTLRPATGLLALDIETTGLNWESHQVWEIGWVLRTPEGTGTPQSRLVEHSLVGADAESLRIGRRDAVVAGQPLVPIAGVLAELARIAGGATLVAANDALDRAFMEPAFRRAGMEPPWHHRAINVEVFAMPLLGGSFHQPPGLQTCAEALGVPYDADRHHSADYDALLALDVYDAACARYASLGVVVAA